MRKDFISIILVLGATIFTSLAHLLFKLGVDNFSTLIDLINFNLIFGVLLYGIGGLLLLSALKLGKVSIVYPFFSLGYVWTAIIGFAVLNEVLGIWNYVGIFAIMSGITFIGLEAKK